MRVAGVDGTKGGWVAVVLNESRWLRDVLIPRVDTDYAELGDVAVIAVDVPIGFGPRRADEDARRYLSQRGSTVFSAPPREVLQRPFGPGLGVSAQAHALGARILWTTELARRDSRIREVHPEVSFRAMNGDAPLRYRKKSAGGAFERLALLADQGIEVAPEATATAPLDDVLDAAAAAWSAHRIATGAAWSLPDPPERVDGLDVAIWA